MDSNQPQKRPPWRPREHNREELASKLVEWARLPDSINLNKFCALNEIVPSKLSQWAKEDEFFRQAYEYAKSYLGSRREEMLNTESLHVKAYDLNATTYDFFLKEERMAQAKYEADLKAQETKAYSEEDEKKLDRWLSMLEGLQNQSKSDRNTADNISKID